MNLDQEISERAALTVKRHAKDESDLSYLLDMLGLTT